MEDLTAECIASVAQIQLGRGLGMQLNRVSPVPWRSRALEAVASLGEGGVICGLRAWRRLWGGYSPLISAEELRSSTSWLGLAPCLVFR